MKIKLPEKRFFTPIELASRWECLPSDVIHLVETEELPAAQRRAAIAGKRQMYFGYYGFERKIERPCWEPTPPDEHVAHWEQDASRDDLIIQIPIALDAPVDPTDHFRVFTAFEKFIKQWEIDRPEDFEMVILLQDVLSFEAKSIQDETMDVAEEKPLATTERNTLLRQIGALSLALAEQSNKYKRGERPNGLQIANAAGEIVDALPSANSAGTGGSSIRESIRQGIELLTAI